jgi:hypothetical protein
MYLRNVISEQDRYAREDAFGYKTNFDGLGIFINSRAAGEDSPRK